jgi:hypothetical protein
MVWRVRVQYIERIRGKEVVLEQNGWLHTCEGIVYREEWRVESGERRVEKSDELIHR